MNDGQRKEGERRRYEEPSATEGQRRSELEDEEENNIEGIRNMDWPIGENLKRRVRSKK